MVDRRIVINFASRWHYYYSLLSNSYTCNVQGNNLSKYTQKKFSYFNAKKIKKNPRNFPGEPMNAEHIFHVDIALSYGNAYGLLVRIILWPTKIIIVGIFSLLLFHCGFLLSAAAGVVAQPEIEVKRKSPFRRSVCVDDGHFSYELAVSKTLWKKEKKRK